MAISLFLAYFVRIFCYHSNGKSKITAWILHLVILLTNQSDETNETQLSVSGSRGGQMCPLTHVALSYSQIDIVTYVRSCWRLTAQLTECKHFLFNAP